MAASQITMPQVSSAWPQPWEGTLTYEGLFVGASLFHVGAWPNATAAVMHLVHNATTQKGSKGERTLIILTGMRQSPRVAAKGSKQMVLHASQRKRGILLHARI